jgi:precorrin isomerase
MIHTTGDFGIMELVRFSSGVIDAAVRSHAERPSDLCGFQHDQAGLSRSG